MLCAATTSPSAQERGAGRARGRPFDSTLDDRVLDACLNLLLESDVGSPVTISAVTERSGVSRAAIYRRWPTREALLITALDWRRSEIIIQDSGDLLADLLSAYTASPDTTPVGFDKLLRRRIVLALEDPAIQRAYWSAHVTRRREAVRSLLIQGRQSGRLRSDMDIESTIDLIAGVQYYQFVVRGASTSDPAALVRVHTAIRTVWQGILA